MKNDIDVVTDCLRCVRNILTNNKSIILSKEDVGFFMMSAYDDSDVVQVEKEVKTVLKDIKDINPKDDEALGSFNLGKVFRDTVNFVDGSLFLIKFE